MTQNPRPVIDALEDLLDTERGVISNGDLDGITRIATLKEDLLRDLGQAEGLPPDQLNRIRQKADHNQRLLEAVSLGVKAATRRLDAIRKAQKPTNVYGPSGVREQLGSNDGSIEKRA